MTQSEPRAHQDAVIVAATPETVQLGVPHGGAPDPAGASSSRDRGRTTTRRCRTGYWTPKGTGRVALVGHNMRMWRFRIVLPAVLVPLALSGCGDTTQATPTNAAAGWSEPTTARALAYVAAEHAGTPDSAVRERDAAEEFTSGGVGTELRYGSDGEYDGDMLVVAAGSGLDPSLIDCEAEATESLAGCITTDQGMLMWENEAPEEDPGVVYVVVDKGEGAALVFYAGPSITGDPRKLDMPISTEVLFAIANDPRVDTTTSDEAAAAGADLSFWQGPTD